jgi:hypothetical protein
MQSAKKIRDIRIILLEIEDLIRVNFRLHNNKNKILRLVAVRFNTFDQLNYESSAFTSTKTLSDSGLLRMVTGSGIT